MRKTLLIAALSVAFVCGARAEVQTNNFRQMSLQECVQLALANNFDIQIERFNPEIAGFNYQRLRGAYYDPTFDTTVLHSYNSREGGLNQTGQHFGSTVS